MTTQDKSEPEIVTYKIPRIELYQVTDDELRRIEEGHGQVGQNLTFATASLSAFLSFVIALLTTNTSPVVKVIFIIIVIVSFLVCAYASYRWVRDRRRGPGVISSIRSRKTEQPAVPSERN